MALDRREPLVLLPGLLCDAAFWEQQRIGLSDVAEVIVADLSGQSRVEDMARATLEATPTHFALAGHSMGGYVALEIMRQAPERVTKLALIGTQPATDTPEQAERRRGLIARTELGEFEAMLDDLIPLLLPEERLGDRRLEDEIRTMAKRVGPEVFLRHQQAIITRPDSTGTLPSIACDVLVSCGRQDVVTPVVSSELMADRIATAQLSVLEGCGHMAPMERPSRMNELMRAWLAGGDPEGADRSE